MPEATQHEYTIMFRDDRQPMTIKAARVDEKTAAPRVNFHTSSGELIASFVNIDFYRKDS